MDFSYIFEQLTSFTIEEVILKICYFVISIIVSKVSQLCWKKVKTYVNERRTIRELSTADKEFIQNNNFEFEVDKEDEYSNLQELKRKGIVNIEFCEDELQSFSGTYLCTVTNKKRLKISLTKFGKRIKYLIEK
ncbi:2OG-Fe(II) oxygenase family protein [Haemophilus parainfluenzae]|uniref:2OG-Fe(II) oxygenase family protein n=1 Tax=Haemophilus parainfluenzae TaxID=729 RepID=UPI00066D8055|nr:2OG-Fe(II) oxygenase family protein [Haemophilus parainfluenzae]